MERFRDSDLSHPSILISAAKEKVSAVREDEQPETLALTSATNANEVLCLGLFVSNGHCHRRGHSNRLMYWTVQLSPRELDILHLVASSNYSQLKPRNATDYHVTITKWGDVESVKIKVNRSQGQWIL
ncbi:hypothetical protein NPIL_489061 [Nephila pilipes]|uniref:Uncharacterized protein n=1 Tax=Nephila pilipes TaxID=299642 RepID=A0A8X6MSK9_NEPPI|nr:hypothetical protein NPIL_489061 [Nephila pilipes]